MKDAIRIEKDALVDLLIMTYIEAQQATIRVVSSVQKEVTDSFTDNKNNRQIEKKLRPEMLKMINRHVKKQKG